MPVTIPQLQKIDSTPDLSQNARIDIKAQNNADNILSATNSVVGVVDKGAQVYQEFENDTIRKLGAQAEQKYSGWVQENLQKLKSYKGDPTDAYADFEKQSKEQYDNILQERPDLNDRVKSGLQNYLDSTVAAQNVHVMKQRGAQQETYKNNLFESTVKLKKDNLGLNAGYIQSSDPSSFFPMDKNIDDIKTTITKRSMDQGLAKQLPDDAKSWNSSFINEEGKVVKVDLNPIAQQRIAKELSEGISSSINSMTASGYSEEAQLAAERYKNYLDPKASANVNNKFKASAVKDEAYSQWGDISKLPDSDQMKAISKIEDPEIKDRVLQIKDTNDTRMQHFKDRKVKDNYELLANRIQNKQDGDNPYYGMSDLHDDPVLQQTWEHLDAKHRKSIQEMVKAPNQTDPKSEIAIQNLFFGKDPDHQIENTSPTDFNTYLQGLSKSDRSKYNNMYNKLNMQSASEERTSFKQAGQMLQNQLIIDGHITKDRFGKISGDDETTLYKAQNNLIDALSTQGKMDQKQLKDFVKDFSASEIKGKVFSPQPRVYFQGSAKAIVPNPTQSASAIQGTTTTQANSKNNVVMSNMDAVNLKKKYYAQYGSFPSDNDPKFKTFVQNNR